MKSFKEDISHTALGVALRRTFTNIPNSQEIFDIVQNIMGPVSEVEKHCVQITLSVLPYFESRYLFTDLFLKQSGIKQVLEMASGLSPRCFNLAQDSEMECVEVDLQDEIDFKRQVIAELAKKKGIEPYPNHSLFYGDVSNPGHVIKAQTPFMCQPKQPIFATCEGLLRYMNWPDKTSLCQNMMRMFQVHGGGMWVTPDIELLSDANATPESRARYDMMAKEWGFDVRPFLFRNMREAVYFFNEQGFNVEKHCHLEIIDQLVSPKRANLNMADVETDLAKRFTFVLHPK